MLRQNAQQKSHKVSTSMFLGNYRSFGPGCQMRAICFTLFAGLLFQAQPAVISRPKGEVFRSNLDQDSLTVLHGPGAAAKHHRKLYRERELIAHSNIYVTASRNYSLGYILPPSSTDYADMNHSHAIIANTSEVFGGGVDALIDGHDQTSNQDPHNSCFYQSRNLTTRYMMDLRDVKSVTNIYTYSWHGSTRSNQVYDLYYAPGRLHYPAMYGKHKRNRTELETFGWEFVARIRTPYDRETENKVGVEIRNVTGEALFETRFLLFDLIVPVTFFGEIDVYTVDDPEETLDTGIVTLVGGT